MTEKVEHIGKREIVWSYIGTAFMIGAGVILLPFILHKMPQETVGICGLILAPGLVQLAYQNWKWPGVVIKELWGK